MALNLSRNTKVFVSSVNGVGATGGVKTCHVSTAGSAYAVGDIVTFTGGSGSGFKCIVQDLCLRVVRHAISEIFHVDEQLVLTVAQRDGLDDDKGHLLLAWCLGGLGVYYLEEQLSLRCDGLVDA